jgi:hypothetical protein
MEMRLQMGNEDNSHGSPVVLTVLLSQRCAQLAAESKSEFATENLVRGSHGEDMKKTLLLASFLILAGRVEAQGVASGNGILNGAGSINNLSGIGSASGINGAGSINASSATAPVVPASAPGAAADRNVNQNSKNPGEYVPSRFSNYGDAVALGVVESGIRPLTVAEAARLAQAQKKNAEQKRAIVLDRDANGNLVIAPAAKQ